jgi:hypothetical protein
VLGDDPRMPKGADIIRVLPPSRVVRPRFRASRARESRQNTNYDGPLRHPAIRSSKLNGRCLDDSPARRLHRPWLMLLWTIAYFVAGLGLLRLWPVLRPLGSMFGQPRAILQLRESAVQVRVLEEMLASGLVPPKTEWGKIRTFPAPWNRILSDSLRDLREQGAPVLPTLSRVRKTLQEQVEFLLESRVRSAQALHQAALAVSLIPAFAGVLHFTLPGVREAGGAFVLLALFSFLLSSLAFISILTLAERARYGNLRPENREWWSLIHSTMERILALIASGSPPDLAWRKALEELYRCDPSLAHAWGTQVWEPFGELPLPAEGDCARLILGLGVEMRRSIQTSLIEGRGCLDRLESIHSACLTELRMTVKRELELLPNRCLKPLFLFVLPGVVLLLAGGLWISMKDSPW